MTSHSEQLPDPLARQHAIKLGVLAASTVAQMTPLTTKLIRELKELGVSRRALYEIMLQTYLHDGYATALEATATLERIWPGGEEDKHLLESAGWDEWLERGQLTFQKVYGIMSDRVSEYIGGNSPELASWMIAEGYGKVLARGGLDMQTREIGTVAVLVMKNRSRQLYSHLRGSIRVGVPIAELDQLLEALIQHFPDRPGISEAPFLLRTIETKKDWE
jgi:alkylhydroperoxidase/carboxymuconolactone decarboxylase family protein YurZ